ncbi:MAG: fumarylacetoacetate hydrolase family protein, partial [Shimia sp.]
NDWSARDIQAWEYQPLGPFQSKATATSISPWIVTRAALEPFRRPVPERAVPVLSHLGEPHPTGFDITLSVDLTTAAGKAHLSQTSFAGMYWSSAQQLAHHTTSGCPMTPGDLLGSGTVSGPDRAQRGCLLELSWGGQHPVEVPGGTRTFLEDGDTVTLTGAAEGPDYRIGFGSCTGTVLPATEDPYGR